MVSNKERDLWPRCPSCNTGNVARLWTVGGHEPIVAAKVSSAPFAPSKDIDGAGIATLHVSPEGKEIAIDTGFRCRECGKHWFQIPGDRMKAVDKLLDFAKDLQRAHDKPSLAACNMLHEEQQKAVQAGEPDTVDLTKPLWVLHVDEHNEDPGFYIFTDEYSAWQFLATEIVNEIVTENDYPGVQALLDKFDPAANVEAVTLFYSQCDSSKHSFSIARTEGPLHPNRLPAGDHSGDEGMKMKKKNLKEPVDNCCCPLCHYPLRMTGFCDASRDFNPEGEYGNLEEEDIEYCDFTEMGYVCTNYNCKYRFTTEKTKQVLLYTLYKLMKIAEGFPVLPDDAAPKVY